MIKASLSIFATLFYALISESFAKSLTLGIASVEKNTHASKLGREIVQIIGKKIGVNFKVENLPSKRASRSLRAKTIDGEIARVAGYKSYVPGLIQVKEPIVTLSHYAYSTSTDIKIDGWKSLVPYSVVYISGAKIIEINLKPIHKNLHPIATNEQALHFLASSRADIFVNNSIVVESLLHSKKLNKLGVKRLEPAINIESGYTYFLEKHADIARRYEAALKELKRDGTYNRLLQKANLLRYKEI